LKPLVLLEPANPHDFSKAELTAIGDSLVAEIGAPFDVVPVLREESGYGGPLNEVLHVWLEVAETVDAAAFAYAVAAQLGRVLRRRWKADKESCAPGDRPRKRVASIYGPDDRPLVEVEVKTDGTVTENATPAGVGKAAHPRPSATRPVQSDS
jgi:hypothetical protein